MCLIKVIRISQAKFHCNRLTTVYKIFKITRVSFLDHIVSPNLAACNVKCQKVKGQGVTQIDTCTSVS